MGKGGDIGKATELPPNMEELAGVKSAGVKSVKGMQTDFIWVETDEPHATRRKQILAAHPEVRELFGPDEYAVYKVTAVVLSQLALAYLVRSAPWWFLVPFAYAVGAWFNHNLFLAIHELSHNLAFQTPLYNKLLGLFANIPIGIPMSVTFQKYHLEHHRYQGIEGVDMDVPTYAEGRYVTNTLAKLVWVILQLFFYAIRPVFVNPKPVGIWELSNLAVNVVADAAMLYFWGFKPIAYLLLASFLGGGLHPAAGHFIAEHYVFLQGQETYSYYGPLNFLLWHVGFHNEHHDFPRIPGSRLHKLKAMAPEFYDNLAFHTSWSRVIYNYITDPTVGPFSRVMRKRKPTTRAGAATEASKAH